MPPFAAVSSCFLHSGRSQTSASLRRERAFAMKAALDSCFDFLYIDGAEELYYMANINNSQVVAFFKYISSS